MTAFHLPTIHGLSDETKEKACSALCIAGFVAWSAIGLAIFVVLVSKFAGLN
jgi:hypothetical protein